MKITKFVHSCLLVETPDRAVLFDPGVFSAEALKVDNLSRLDDIFITHEHSDHFSPELVSRLAQKFPNVRITTTQPVIASLAGQGITASNRPPEGVSLFDSPHAAAPPLMPTGPAEIGVHYLDQFSHPGDSHDFHETKAILALPVQAPWGSPARALELAFELKPRFVVPVHDWHWSAAGRDWMYDWFDRAFAPAGIQLVKPQTGQPIDITL